MPLTVTNTNSLSLLNILNRTQANQSNTLTQLSTGSRINKGADDPAGLIALRNLETELKSVDAALSNTQRTEALLGVADKAYGEIASHLDEIVSLAQASSNSAGLSASEVAANQSQIDNAIEAIDRIVKTTSFNGKKLLDGSQSVNVTKTGAGAASFSDIQVFSRPTSGGDIALNVSKTADAAQGSLTIVNEANDTGQVSAAGSIAIQGNLGTAIIDVVSTDTAVEIRAKINAVSSETGVTADNGGTSNSGDVRLLSSDYGSSQFVRATNISGSIATEGRDEGADATVTVNGVNANVDGTTVYFNSNGTSLAFEVAATGGAASATFTLAENTGATFQLGTDSSTRTTIGLESAFSYELGNATIGYLSSLKSGGANDLSTDPGQAATIAQAAAEQIAVSQGRLGGFQKFQVGAALNQLSAVQEGLTAAKSVIGDTDFAQASADLNQQNVLLQSAISLLGVANQQSSQVLALLR
ncbi:MAG: flagellin [Phycisphaerae bacterium]|nr:flagellin [Phycisphaerae bacterium]